MNQRYIDIVKPLLSEREELCFNLFSLIFENEKALIKTDMMNYIIAQANEQATIWMWISPSIKDVSNVVGELAEQLLHNTKVHINTSDEYGEKILQLAAIKIGVQYKVYMPMNVYVYRHTEVIPKRGHMIIPCEQHRERLKSMVKQMKMDTKGIRISENSADAMVTDLIRSGNLFLWEDEDIVSMAKIDHEATYGRLNSGVTDRKYRGNGYMGMLLDEMCQMLIGRGVIPMLYADARNPSANKAHRKVGFEMRGQITEYQIC